MSDTNDQEKTKVAESVTQFSEERIFTVCKIPTLVLSVNYWPETMTD